MSTAITSYLLKMSIRPTYTMTLAGGDKNFDIKELCYVRLAMYAVTGHHLSNEEVCAIGMVF